MSENYWVLFIASWANRTSYDSSKTQDGDRPQMQGCRCGKNRLMLVAVHDGIYPVPKCIRLPWEIASSTVAHHRAWINFCDVRNVWITNCSSLIGCVGNINSEKYMYYEAHWKVFHQFSQAVNWIRIPSIQEDGVLCLIAKDKKW